MFCSRYVVLKQITSDCTYFLYFVSTHIFKYGIFMKDNIGYRDKG